MKLEVLFIIFAFLLEIATSLKICDKSPRWSLSGKRFPKDYPAKVKLLAFLAASCPFCRKQSQSLGELETQLKQELSKDIKFLIVNAFDSESVAKGEIFKNLTTVSMIQDTPKKNIWGVYNGSLDDMLIFNKCDRLITHLKLPDSVVTSGKVKEEVLKAFNNEDICPCKPKSKSRVF